MEMKSRVSPKVSSLVRILIVLFLVGACVVVWNMITGSKGSTPKEKTSEDSLAAIKGTIYADLIILNNGNGFQGAIIEDRTDSYLVKIPLGEVTIKKSDIKKLQRLSLEEACFDMGNKFRENKNFYSAMEEYKKALRINSSYKPAIDAILSLKKEEIAYNKQKKLSRKAKSVLVKQDKQPAQTKSADKKVLQYSSINLNVIDKYKIKKKYEVKDFGFDIGDDLIVNGFCLIESCSDSSKASPAQEAGLRLGDKIVKLNGLSTSGKNRADMMNLIGSHRHIKVTVERNINP